jgi:hypothetical protein
VTGGWHWARLQLVGLEDQGEHVLVDVLQLDGDAVESGGIERGLPATVSFGPASRQAGVTERIDGWLRSEVPVMDCFAAVLPPGPTVVLVHDEEYLVLDGVAST